MAKSKLLKAGFPGVILAWGSKLKFPYLFLLTATLFVADLAIPDVIPLVDEILFGLATLLLAKWKKPTESEPTPTAEGQKLPPD